MKNSINILGAGAMMFALSMPVNANAGDYPVAVNRRHFLQVVILRSWLLV
jgi:hypothetical protein